MILLSHFLCEPREYLGNKENAIPRVETGLARLPAAADAVAATADHQFQCACIRILVAPFILQALFHP